MNPDKIKMLRLDADTDQLVASLVEMLKDMSPPLREDVFQVISKITHDQDVSVSRMHAAANSPRDIQREAIFEYFRASMAAIGVTEFLKALGVGNEDS